MAREKAVKVDPIFEQVGEALPDAVETLLIAVNSLPPSHSRVERAKAVAKTNFEQGALWLGYALRLAADADAPAEEPEATGQGA